MKYWIFLLFVAIVSIPCISGQSTRLRVGNLSFSTTEGGLRWIFGFYGHVEDAIVMTDRETANSRGFGFVTMSDRNQANAAIKALDRAEFEGRRITVDFAASIFDF